MILNSQRGVDRPYGSILISTTVCQKDDGYHFDQLCEEPYVNIANKVVLDKQEFKGLVPVVWRVIKEVFRYDEQVDFTDYGLFLLEKDANDKVESIIRESYPGYDFTRESVNFSKLSLNDSLKNLKSTIIDCGAVRFSVFQVEVN